MVDGPRNDREAFDRAMVEMRRRLADGERVLVHCSAGASGSVAVATTVVALCAEVELDVAFDRVLWRWSDAAVHPALRTQAKRVWADRTG